ncbi:MAG: sensor histidine kinase [Kutzneria sp.]|nr:sensor histidine kinase [Kutzneria sp.]
MRDAVQESGQGREKPDFRHEALLYTDTDQLQASVSEFIREGLCAEESVLVAVRADTEELLRADLGAEADAVRFLELNGVGRNPARIIPMLRSWLEEQAGRRLCRGVCEPMAPDRDTSELAEYRRHESLLNLAFVGLPAWRLLCPYDVTELDHGDIASVLGDHSVVAGATNPDYRPPSPATVLAGTLPTPPRAHHQVPFDMESISSVRTLVASEASRAGLTEDGVQDLVLATHEVMVNSIDHGGGKGVLLLWRDPKGFVCEVRDSGVLTDPLAGRRKPTTKQRRGRGLWIVNQVCDLVQLRSSPATGTVVRVMVFP